MPSCHTAFVVFTTDQKGGRVALELAVSQALMRARALERALHSHETWFVSLKMDQPTGTQFIMMRATRTITDTSVVFTVPLSIEGSGECTATLWCGEEVMLVRPAAVRDDGGTRIDWELRLADAVSA